MSNGIRKLAIDFGNSFINVVGETKKGEFKKACILSTYGLIPNAKIIKKNVVAFKGTMLQLGKSGGDEFTNVRKVDREYLEHQILWATYATMGAGDHYIKLAAGLPLVDYTSDSGEKEIFKAHLEGFKIISGEVCEQKVTVHIISPVEICPEGYSAVDVLTDYIPRTKRTLVIDIGMKTTDYALVEFDEEEGMFVPVAYGTIPKGLDTIYAPVIEALKSTGTTITATALDAIYAKDGTITLKDKDNTEFNVKEAVLKSVQPCKSILKDVANDPNIGDTTDYHKILVGGGSKALEDIMSTDDLTNVIAINEELKYYANALGYFEALEA